MFFLRRTHLIRFLGLWILLLTAVTAVSAQDQGRLQITEFDSSQFPTISFSLIATDENSKPLLNINTLTIHENGQEISNPQFATQPKGVEIAFVLDANPTYNTRDGGDPPRREKVRDSLVLFATQYMSQTQMDRVWIIAPDGDSGRLLGDGLMTFPNQLINAMNFYDPGPLAATPMQAMMEMALIQFASQNSDDGRYRAVVIFSDADSLENQLDFDLLVEEAQNLKVAIFTVILGVRADPNEIVSAGRLGDPTNGFWLHMPQPADAEPLYQILQANGTQNRLTYRSQISHAGQHTLELSLGDLVGAHSFSLEVLPPAVQLIIDNSLPIRRVAPEYDTPLTAIEPASQLAVAQVTWPDGFRRSLTSASLLVDGVPQPGSDTVVLTGEGLLNFDWQIRELDEGVYNLTVQVTDELGLESTSPPLPLTIEVARPAPPVVEVAVEEDPVVAEPVAPESLPANLTQRLGLAGIVIGIVAIFLAMFMLVVAVTLVRRRGAPPAVAPVTPVAPPLGYGEHEATQVMMPAFALPRGGAYLEPLENAADYAVPIQLPQANTAIGRDPKLAQIVFNDKSVSRLHARIMETNGQYRLYDEGSASGTYLNFERISLTPQPLKDNDDIHIGRVHLRFRLPAAAQDADSTQIMAPIQRPGQPAAEPDDLSTQPFMPHQPPGGGAARPQAPAQEDPDDVSTQPYMPHSPRR
jgi:hypothetical protein